MARLRFVNQAITPKTAACVRRSLLEYERNPPTFENLEKRKNPTRFECTKGSNAKTRNLI
jgi:hypothetical protein